MPDPHPANRLSAAFLSSALLLLAGLSASGCVRAQYAADSLPTQLAARPPVGLSDVDLSSLARPAPPTEMLHPGDTIKVSIATGLEQRVVEGNELRIGDDGVVGVPLIGPVHIAGMNLTEAEQAIGWQGRQRGLYVNPIVTVTIVQPRSVRVTVAGAVKKPATYDLPQSNSSLLAALTRAEGLTEDADTVVEIRMPGMVNPATGGPIQQASHVSGGSAGASTLRIDLARGSEYPTEALKLRDGAVVMVRSRTPGTISVMGLVKEPGNFELPTDRETFLLDAIAMAGGTTLSVANRVVVTRRAEDGSMVTISSSLNDAKANGPSNLLLTDGDIVSVEETPATVVLDTVRTFFRIGFSSALPLF